MLDTIVAPSVLSANFADISNELEQIKNSGAAWVHLDVMDGCFVPNITFGPKFISDIRKKSDLFFDTHLMIERPEAYINLFADAGSQAITVHYEATRHLDRVINQIKSNNCLAGVSIVPSTPVSVLEDIINYVDLVLVMSVNPGFGGQSFIPYSVDKIKKIRKMCDNDELFISVDGGINNNTYKQVKEAGANVLVTGSAFFKAQDKKGFVSLLCKQ